MVFIIISNFKDRKLRRDLCYIIKSYSVSSRTNPFVFSMIVSLGFRGVLGLS